MKSSSQQQAQQAQAQGLLPKHHDEFGSKQYWDSFFEQRGQQAFEWYGGFRDLRAFCLRHASPGDKLLMLGCGNSSFSADLYDNGYTDLVNVDFSESVIESMSVHNQSRPLMRWEVMDMTELTFEDEAFDVVLDKGALDALMSTNEEEILRRASSMFEHVDRVLAPGGKYLCISLCEGYILNHLLSWFLQRKPEQQYALSIEIVTPATPSPFKPFFLTFTKPKIDAAVTNGEHSSDIEVYFDSFGSSTKYSTSLSVSAVKELILQTHYFNKRRFELSRVEVGRLEVFDVHTNSEHDAVALQIPRFSVLIFDHSARATRSCAVFFVPAGRETDYQFTSENGLAALAVQAQCRRLLAVRCNRPHKFPPMAQLQSELSPIAMYLAPADIGSPDVDPIPFMAVQEENDWEVVQEGSLEVAGKYVVEEMSAEKEQDSDKYVWRRLIFLQNQHFVQTEAKLLYPTAASKVRGRDNKTKGKGKSKAKSKGKRGKINSSSRNMELGDSELLLFDYCYLDDHHKAMLVALLCDKTDIISAGSLPRIGKGQATVRTTDGDGARALLIGLGGGALAMALQKYLPSLYLDVVDLVPGLDDLAINFFGFVMGPRCKTVVADGANYIMQLNSSSADHSVFAADKMEQDNKIRYHSIFLDVDSKDNSLGLSAPPVAFLDNSLLTHVHDRLLLPGGSLCVNVVARNKTRLADFISNLNGIFCQPDVDSALSGRVYCLKPSSDNVNLTVHAVKGRARVNPVTVVTGQVQACTLSTTKQKSKKVDTSSDESVNATGEKKARARCLDRWLSAVGLTNDPLELADILDSINVAI